MDYSTFTLSTRVEDDQEKLPVLSLYQTLQALPDRRRKQGKRYELALVLSLLVLAKLAGQTSLSAATEWVRHRCEPFALRFGLRRQQMPCQMTYCNVLARVDSKQLDELLTAFFIRWEAQSRCGEEPSRLLTPAVQAEHDHVAVDGKALRATSKEPHPVHQLSCYEVATGTVLWHCNVKDKENEISALKSLFAPSWVSGRIVTLDAMHTQRELCAHVHRLAGAYLLIAKDNQPTLREDIADLFEDCSPDRRRWKEAETWDKGHGRLEHRHIVCSPDLNDWFGKDWEGIEQVFRLERTTRILKTGRLRHEVVYGLSSLSMSEASPQRILQLVREHWAIENRLHHRRDVTLGEDGCQTRTGSAPSVLAQLNSAVLSLMDRIGVGNVARQMRYFNAHVDQALDLVLTGQCLVY
ncbi:ISAs1 family transposase [Ktedonobacter sp. SOSP1-85]|uniref:ISAs1 family transposase n=1 Tax=Ktedonobacter sp. SOSP1-85 TaxID=2778367 RepID=UPI0019160CF9|nr:ISAs1 family transposase [Ktedonobacter sp. SOSP1-85]GHO75972.1 ISAs1 family transposase [Ktedonobacter sp. SOSP1-85]